MKRLEFSRAIEAAPDLAWSVVSDVVGYADVAPSLSRAEILEGSGEGMVRRCYDGRDRGWSEVCTLWEEGRRYAMRVRTETYPFNLRQIFNDVRGEWEVAPSPEGAMVTMRFDLQPSALGRALWWPLRRTFARQSELLLDNWQRDIEARAASGAQKAA
jgi:ribosome-associated toxin RatA of RatAB toxin-antitoxin module